MLAAALSKAQSAVLLDGSNNVPDALAAYKEAVRLLEKVIERTDSEPSRAKLDKIVTTMGAINRDSTKPTRIG
jgi:hypothetical protein